MEFLDLLQGIILSGFIGLAIGNFATNPIYRLPRNESLFGRDPYCGDCNALLKPKDLFPVFSWLSTWGKCRYCGSLIPGAYVVAEALIGVLFVALYLKYGFSERFLLTSFAATGFVMLGMMLYIDNFFSDRTLVVCIMLGTVFRTLVDGELYGFLGTGYAGLLAGVLLWKISGSPMKRDMAAVPAAFKLLVCAGIWLYPLQLALLVVAVVLLQVAGCKLQKTRVPATCNLQPATQKQWLVEWVILTGAVVAMLLG